MKKTLATLAALTAIAFTTGRVQAQQRRPSAPPPAPQAPANSIRAWAGAEDDFAPPVIGPEYQMLGRIFQDTEHFRSSYTQEQILPALVAKYPPIYGYRLDLPASADPRRRKFSYGAPLGCDWMAKAILALGGDQGVTVETKTTPDVWMVTRAAANLTGQDYVLLRCNMPGYVPSIRPDLSAAYLGDEFLRTDPGLSHDNLSRSRWVFKIGVQAAKTNFSSVVTQKDTITVSDQTGREWKQNIGELWSWLMRSPEYQEKMLFQQTDQDLNTSGKMIFRFEYLIVHTPEKMPVKE